MKNKKRLYKTMMIFNLAMIILNIVMAIYDIGSKVIPKPAQEIEYNSYRDSTEI